MARKKTASTQAVNTAVTNPSAIFKNIKLPDTPTPPGPKVENVSVGPFRLPGVKIDPAQFTEQQLAEMRDWARDNSAYVAEDQNLFSWKQAKLRDWFVLRWG